MATDIQVSKELPRGLIAVLRAPHEAGERYIYYLSRPRQDLLHEDLVALQDTGTALQEDFD